jgi:hypothetical protein
MSSTRPKNISTSALARHLGLPSLELFTLLRELGWIKRGANGWLLTGKGEFEGGSYVQSERYGRYIVWPEAVLEHARLQNACAEVVVSASSIGRACHVSGRYINHVLHELGWIVPGVKGWRITAAGKALGGVEIENEETSIPFVKWPPELLGNARLQAALVNSYGAVGSGQTVTRGKDDLFASQQTALCCGIDGHQFEQLEMAAICNWLYFAGLTHACGRHLPGHEELQADFYLPGGNVYIEYWGERGTSATLSEKFARKAALEEQGLVLLELSASDIEHLDEILARELLRHGVPVY